VNSRVLLGVSAAAFATTVAGAAAAVPPATSADRVTTSYGSRSSLAPSLPIHIDLTAAEALTQIGKIAAWDVTMQSTACAMPDAGPDAGFDACTAGGVIEVESGPGNAIIASDNTQEAIGIWNLDKTLNGVAYPTNITKAFDFLATHPGYDAWQVAMDPGPDYYSVYNCGWGVRAVMLYEKTTGDMSHHAYGETCAQHIAANAMGLVTTNAELLNVGPAGWGASGLWLWGDTYSEDAAMKATAATIGGAVKTWIEAFPSRLATEEWAMTGAAPYYGVIESYMKENPSELTAWVTSYGPMLGGWIDESMPASPNDWTDWRNAWNGWNMIAQFTTADVLGATAGATNEATATSILAQLVAQANPTTGAIPGSQQRPSTEAESWITAYLVYFGLLQVVDAATSADAGAKDAGVRDSGVATKDASVSKDAGAIVFPDAAQAVAHPAETGSSGGCSSVGRGNAEAPYSLLGLGLPVAFYVRRRRTARR
jgi:hypothetical protein